tara:strand:+ start:160 stop:1938 length:1779 start_codon:yes stop_codon:yes gene_type:complete
MGMSKQKQLNEKYAELVALKGNSEALYNSLEKVWAENRSNKEDDLLAKLIIKLNKDADVDFCALFCSAIENSKHRVFNILDILKDTLSELNLTSDGLLTLFEKVYQETQNDMMASVQYEPLKALVEKQSDFCRELLDKLLTSEKDFITNYISVLYQEFFKRTPGAIHKELCDLKDSERENIIFAVVNALSNLPYEEKEYKPFLDETLSVYEYIDNRGLPNTARCLADSYGRLIKHKPEVVSKLSNYLKLDNPEIDYMVSRVLMLNLEVFVKEPWFEDLFFPLSRTKIQHQGIIRNLDFILHGLIAKCDKPELAIGFFEKWVIDSDYQIKTERLDKMFMSTFPDFVRDKKRLHALVTNFFNHENPKIHGAVSEIISYCKLHKIQDVRLEKSILKSLDDQDVVFIARKILGYTIDAQIQCSLVFSILDKSVTSKAVQNIVYDVFTQHIGKGYPGSTIEFLEGQKKKTKSKVKLELTDKIITHIKSWRDVYKDLPRLKETMPPSQQSRRIMREEARVMGQSMKEAQKDSIINQICRVVPMKYGSGTFSYFDGNYTPVSKLGSHSISEQLPFSLSTHIVKFTMEINDFRRAKRGQK